MTVQASDLLETILRQCQAAEPEPWYPKLYAESSGVPRDNLDAPLEKLRMGNLIRLTEWVQGRGQGYQLTPEGRHVLSNGRELAKVRDGKLPVRAEPVQPTPREFRGQSAWDRGEQIRQAFLDPPTPVVSRAILFGYIAVFLAGLYLAQKVNLPANEYLAGAPNNQAGQDAYHRIVSMLGSVNMREIMQGEWWRLLTNCFVHFGILHLALNGYALNGIGRFLEPLWGHGRFLVLYLITGIGGSCFALIAHSGRIDIDHSRINLAGGSGALCGMLGSEAAWLFLNRAYLPSQLVAALRRNLLINIILVAIISTFPGVSWGAHLGGALFGVLTGFLLHFQRYGAGPVRALAILGLVLAPIAAVGALQHTITTNPQWIQIKEKLRKETQVNERLDLQNRYKDEVLEADNQTRRAYDEALKTCLDRHPTRRDAEKTKQILESLADAHSRMTKAIERFAGGPSMGEPEIEQERQQVLEYLRALNDRTALAETYLKENRNVFGDNKQALEELDQKINKLKPTWLLLGS